MNIKRLLLFIFLPIVQAGTVCMQRDMQLIVVPGQNGEGGDNIEYSLPKYTSNVHRAPTPLVLPDFGQSRCINDLQKTLLPLLQKQSVNDIIVHASSQGTATILNFFAYIGEKVKSAPMSDRSKLLQKYSREGSSTRTTVAGDLSTLFCYNNLRKIKALILESVMLTGNSAIAHTSQNQQKIRNFFGSYYIMPYLAKLLFPCYAPAGRQAIFSCEYLPKDIPIIIIHAPQDPALSYADSKSLYAHLRYEGYEHIYFISVPCGYHVNMLGEGDEETNALQAILKKYDLLPHSFNQNALDGININKYQPLYADADLIHYNAMIQKERNIVWVDRALKMTLLCFFCYVLYVTFQNC